MSQLVGSACAKCNKSIPSIVTGEFCPKCGNPIHKACKTTSAGAASVCSDCGCAIRDSAFSSTEAPASQPAPVQLRPNKFSTKLMLGGIGAVVCGIWWLVDGLSGSFLEEVIGGLVWKGSILIVAGIASVYYGYRLMSDASPPDSSKR